MVVVASGSPSGDSSTLIESGSAALRAAVMIGR